jgi:hypothetical protein
VLQPAASVALHRRGACSETREHITNSLLSLFSHNALCSHSAGLRLIPFDCARALRWARKECKVSGAQKLFRNSQAMMLAPASGIKWYETKARVSPRVIVIIMQINSPRKSKKQPPSLIVHLNGAKFLFSAAGSAFYFPPQKENKEIAGKMRVERKLWAVCGSICAERERWHSGSAIDAPPPPPYTWVLSSFIFSPHICIAFWPARHKYDDVLFTEKLFYLRFQEFFYLSLMFILVYVLKGRGFGGR